MTAEGGELVKWDSEALTRLIRTARKERRADLCLKGARLVNVLTGKVEKADVAVQDGWIAGWGSYEGVENISTEGMFMAPAFTDGHLHIESTLLSPDRFAAAVVPSGTGAVVADPHEIANVLGLEGIRYFLRATEDLPLDVFFNLPSCVPASPLETSGARLGGADLCSLLPHPRIPGLAEMMNYPGVLHGDPDVVDKLLLFQDRVIDGHAPRLSGHDLNAYLAAGIGSDHECTSLEEGREKLARGMTLMIREGSQSKDLEALLPLVDDHTWPRCMLVSDDRHPDDLLERGHMDDIVNRAVSLGMDPVRAVALATWTPARYFGLQRRGALAPGYRADFTLSPSLTPWIPQRVFKGGVEVAREGELLVSPSTWSSPPPPPGPMSLRPPRAEDFAVEARPGKLRVIGVREGSLLTEKVLADPKVKEGLVVSDVERDLLKLAVFNRYGPADGRPPALGFVQGLGLRRGALASTVAHDSHNLLVAGVTDAALARVADAVRQAGGGMAVGDEDGALEILPLPVAGLMSDRPLKETSEGLRRLKGVARSWGSSLENPFMALSFLALPVIPRLKLTDKGLVDVESFSVVPLFETP